MLSRLFLSGPLTTEALFAELAVAGLVVIVAGCYFTRLADTVADRLNLGAGWVGLILLATVTSLPELVTGATATWIGNVDLALGGILGSCSFNITIIFILNAMWGGGSVLRGAGAAHPLTSAFGALLIALALFGMVLTDKFAGQPAFVRGLELGWAIATAATYLFCMRLAHRYEQRSRELLEVGTTGQPLGPALTAKLLITATVLVAGSWWLAKLGDILSVHEIQAIGRPLGATFVGACFLAIATSLPEIVTSIMAVRLGKLDLALGNIFGSNMFNIFVIPALKAVSLVRGDQVMLAGPASDTTQNLIAGLMAILLTAVAMAGLAYKSQRRVLRRFGFDSVLIAMIYVGGMILLVTEGAIAK